MTTGIRLFVYPARDLAATKALFQALLGVAPYVDQPYYVGFKAGDHEIGLNPNSDASGPVAFWRVQDIKSSLQSLLDAGRQVHQAIKEVGGGKVTALVKDASGNILGLMQEP